MIGLLEKIVKISMRWDQHSETCPLCSPYAKTKSGTPCVAGLVIIHELLEVMK